MRKPKNPVICFMFKNRASNDAVMKVWFVEDESIKSLIEAVCFPRDTSAYIFKKIFNIIFLSTCQYQI